MTKRHLIYINPQTYYGDRDARSQGKPAWHWSPDADAYGEKGRALCGQVFPGSPYVSAEPPARDQHLCPGCEAAIKKLCLEAGEKIGSPDR